MRLSDGLATLVIIAVVIGLYMLAAQADDEAAAEARQRSGARLEQAQQLQQLPRKVSAAYEQGMNDALAAVRDTPDGAALAQACMGSGYRYVGARP